MLPPHLEPLGFNTWKKEEWDSYRTRLKLPGDPATLQFYRQVVYDHFRHFNEHYPDFRLQDYALSLERLTAEQAGDLIRYFHGETMDKWGEQFDEFERRNYDYIIYQRMAKDLTPPFPPIVIEPALLVDRDWRVYGRPLHLVEGTHRVSYLRRMLARGLILPHSSHEFVFVRPVVDRIGVTQEKVP